MSAHLLRAEGASPSQKPMAQRTRRTSDQVVRRRRRARPQTNAHCNEATAPASSSLRTNRSHLVARVDAAALGGKAVFRCDAGLPDRRDPFVAHMEERLSRGRGRWPLSGWWCGVGVVAVRGAVRAFAGFATVGHAHIRGLGTPRPLFVARPLSKVERARWGRVLRRQIAELCARAGIARAASPAATGYGGISA
jgi:hypothetical protein